MSHHPSRLTDPLLGKMWKTKSARFNAHARLTAKHRLSTAATSILAFYLVIASLIPLVFEASLPADGPKIISVITLVISIFLIIITLLESERDYRGEADRMHKCALEISELYNAFQAMTLDEADTNRRDVNDKYSKILMAHEINHKDIDFLRFRLAFNRDFKLEWFGYIAAILRYISLWIVEYWLYILLVFAPPLVFLWFRSNLVF